MPTRRHALALGAIGGAALPLSGHSHPLAHARTPVAVPALPGAEITDLGSPMSALTVVEGAFGSLPDGRLAAYGPAQGENSALTISTVTDPAEAIGSPHMMGAGGGPTIAVAPDQTVYVGTYNNGDLYRWHPDSETMENVGSPTSPAQFLYGLSSAPDGTVYGGTYPDAHVWSYHPDEGFADLGRITDDTSIQYARATAYDSDHHALWVGTQASPRLLRKDLATGEVTQITPAVPFTGSSISDMDFAEGHVIVTNNLHLRVFDAATRTEVDVIDAATGEVTREYDQMGRGVSDARDGKVWFGSTDGKIRHLAHYDLASRTATLTSHTTNNLPLIGYGWTVEDDHDVLYAFSGNYAAGAFRYDLTTNTSSNYTFELAPSPSPLGNVTVAPDGGTVVINAFLNGNGVKRDVASGEITPIVRLGQVEGWGWGENNTLYAGTYPSGSIKEYRPFEEESSTNPRTLAELSVLADQIRPDEVVVRDGRVWATSQPDYGMRGGAVTAINLADGEVTLTRPVVDDHSMCSLAFAEERIFAGSSRSGGTGTSPVPGSAELVELDPENHAIVQRLVPVEGARSITGLLVHDGRLIGLADTTVFEVDLTDFSISRTLALPGISGESGPGAGDIMRHPNGHLYAIAQSGLFVVDPLSFTRADRLGDGLRVKRAALSVDGSLWVLVYEEGFSNPLNHAQVVPTTLEPVDARWLVHVRDELTTVPNRFVAPGRTVADVAATAYPSGRDNDPDGEQHLANLVAEGVISTAERVAISRVGRATR